MWYHIVYINIIKLTIAIDKLIDIYSDYDINDLLTEDAWTLVNVSTIFLYFLG